MWFFGQKPDGLKKSKRQSGVTVSEQASKDERLGSEFILGAIEDGVIMVGKDNLIHLFNPAASKITGWPAEVAVGLDFHNVINLTDIHGQPYPPNTHPFAKALATDKSVRDSKSMLYTRNGKLIPVSLMISPVSETNGPAVKSVVGVLRDVTSEKLEESRRSDFVNTASHEMRTPIAAIEGYVALALNPKISTIDARGRSYLEKAQSSTRQLGQLFQDLLSSSKAEDGRLASYPTVVEMGAIVEQVTEAALFAAQKKGLSLKYLVTSPQDVAGHQNVRPLFYAYVDPNRLREVLHNLIDNAIKYTPQGAIVVTLTGNEAVVQLQVRDSGPGIVQEDLPHLFQKFYRVDNSLTRSVAGTGLGLFLSKKIIELYNGRIWADSQLGRGSTFFINLPRLSTEKALELQQKQAISITPTQTR